MAEDDAGLNRMYGEFFTREWPHYAVCTVRNGAEALDVLSRAQYDLVITDLNMPVLGGLELYRKVLESSAKEASVMPAFIFCSGVRDALDSVRASCPGSRNRFILKPFSVAQITDAVVELLA